MKQLQEVIFSMGQLQLPCHTVTKQLQEEVFSVGSTPRLYVENQNAESVKWKLSLEAGSLGQSQSEEGDPGPQLGDQWQSSTVLRQPLRSMVCEPHGCEE
jgi:hypothetical protein